MIQENGGKPPNLENKATQRVQNERPPPTKKKSYKTILMCLSKTLHLTRAKEKTKGVLRKGRVGEGVAPYP